VISEVGDTVQQVDANGGRVTRHPPGLAHGPGLLKITIACPTMIMDSQNGCGEPHRGITME
jgi:hypothetical protein